MKRAWEMARELFLQARPVVRTAEEQTWEDNLDVSLFYDQNLTLEWSSNVPGRGAPEHIDIHLVCSCLVEAAVCLSSKNAKPRDHVEIGADAENCGIKDPE